MVNAFSRSWQITKTTFSVMKKDKELFLFPIIAAIFSILFILVLVVPAIILPFLAGSKFVFNVLVILVLFIIYFGLALISVFFNVCVVYTAKRRFEKGDAKFWETIKFAFSKIKLIILWALVSATVGVILRILEYFAQRARGIGRFVAGMIVNALGAIWAIATIFVVPSIVYYDLGPFAAIKKSVETIKKTWGESLIRYFGLGLVELLFFIIGIVVGVILILVSVPLGAIALIISIILIGAYFVILITTFSIANTIFNTALFVYADKGKVPEGFDAEVVKNAFARKEKKE